jgi:hypothetical protein
MAHYFVNKFSRTKNMKNLAGVKTADEKIRQELIKAGAEIIEVPSDGFHEVPYTIMGKVGNWTLWRAWYYWVATPTERTMGLPLPAAKVMHEKAYPSEMFDDETYEIYGDAIRVAGHCGCPPPEEWAMLDIKVLKPQMEKLGITDSTYGNLAKLLNEGVLKGERYIDCYHIDSQEGLNEFVRTIKQVDKEPIEQITCSAIHFETDEPCPHQPKNIMTGFVVTGHRHNNCYTTASLLDPSFGYKKFSNVKGFLTNRNRFVDREEAMRIALKAGQVKAGDTQNETKLYSEDLY